MKNKKEKKSIIKNIWKNHKLATLLCILSFYIFINLTEDVLTIDSITNFDLLISSKIDQFWNPITNYIMLFITNIVNELSLLCLCIALSLYLSYKKRLKEFKLLLLSLIFGIISELLIKEIIHRLRPEGGLIQAARYSFPSGHATLAIIFFSILIYSIKNDIKNKIIKNIFIISSILLIVLIGFSRIYLKVHWFSDVLGGFSLGLFWVSLFILILNYKNKK